MKFVKLCREAENDNEEIHDVATRCPDNTIYDQLYNDPNAAVNEDLRLAVLNKLGAIAKKRENLMDNGVFLDLMRSANDKQFSFILHIISHLLSSNKEPLQVFFTGPAGCGKTFVIKLIMECYNRFSETDGYCNGYITCASTGKAAVAIDGVTVHSALKISLSKLVPLSNEILQQYRALFKYVKAIIIDEISMIGAELLAQIDSRLKQITGNFKAPYGGLDIFLIGDLRQLPPVRATPIWRPIKQSIEGNSIWRILKYYELTQVMRQENAEFANMLTKLGNGDILSDDELAFIESRFMTKEDADRLYPNATRLFLENRHVDEYNNKIINNLGEKVISMSSDEIYGTTNAEQLAFVRQTLHKKSVSDAGGVPYEVILALNVDYSLTYNIDTSDGLVNGETGTLTFIEYNDNQEIIRVWLKFPKNSIGRKIRQKLAAHSANRNIDPLAVPIAQKTSNIPLNNNKTIIGKRKNFPLRAAPASTVHRSQGGTFNIVVFNYEKKLQLPLVYVAMTRPVSSDGLILVSPNKDHRFYHGRRQDPSMIALQQEYKRLSSNSLLTVEQKLLNLMSEESYFAVYSFNCQSLGTHGRDLKDLVCQKSTLLLLSETNVDNDYDVNINNFTCISKFKRRHIRSGGVSISHNNNDTVNIVTSNITMNARQSVHEVAASSLIGDVCSAQCKINNKDIVIIVCVYISPKNNVQNIIEFLHFHLLPYTITGSQILGKNYDKIPLIISGDFNVNFAKDDAQPLIDFFKNELCLIMNNSRYEATTRGGTTIDALFSRYVQSIESHLFVSHFSYHKPIITLIKHVNNDENNSTVKEM